MSKIFTGPGMRVFGYRITDASGVSDEEFEI